MIVFNFFPPKAIIDMQHSLISLLLLLGSFISARSCKICDKTFHCQKAEYVAKEDRMEECCVLTCKLCEECGIGTNRYKSYIKQECSQYNNTVCCHEFEEVVVNGECVMPIPSTPSPTTVKETDTTVVATGARLAGTGNIYNSENKNISSAAIDRLIILLMLVNLVLT